MQAEMVYIPRMLASALRGICTSHIHDCRMFEQAGRQGMLDGERRGARWGAQLEALHSRWESSSLPGGAS